MPGRLYDVTAAWALGVSSSQFQREVYCVKNIFFCSAVLLFKRGSYCYGSALDARAKERSTQRGACQ